MTDFIVAFLEAVVASITGGIVLVLGASLISSKARWALLSVLSRLVDLDIEASFDNLDAARDDIERELRRATQVDLLTGRGMELQRDLFRSLLRSRPEGRKVGFRVILPASKADKNDWISIREREAAEYDSAFGEPGLLRDQIRLTAQFLQKYINAKQVELRLADFPIFGRILLTERVLYLTPYSLKRPGRESRVFKFRCGGDFYTCFSNLFAMLWEKGRTSNYKPAEEATQQRRLGSEPT